MPTPPLTPRVISPGANRPERIARSESPGANGCRQHRPGRPRRARSGPRRGRFPLLAPPRSRRTPHRHPPSPRPPRLTTRHSMSVGWHGPVAQRQSSGLLIHRPEVRILPGLPTYTALITPPLRATSAASAPWIGLSSGIDVALAAASLAVVELGAEQLGPVGAVGEPVAQRHLSEQSGPLAHGWEAQRAAGRLDRERSALMRTASAPHRGRPRKADPRRVLALMSCDTVRPAASARGGGWPANGMPRSPATARGPRRPAEGRRARCRRECPHGSLARPTSPRGRCPRGC